MNLDIDIAFHVGEFIRCQSGICCLVLARNTGSCIYCQLLSHDIASGSDKTLCNKICKPLVVYRFTGNVMTSITTLHT